MGHVLNNALYQVRCVILLSYRLLYLLWLSRNENAEHTISDTVDHRGYIFLVTSMNNRPAWLLCETFQI